MLQFSSLSSGKYSFFSPLSELFFPPVICLLFTSAWMQKINLNRLKSYDYLLVFLLSLFFSLFPIVIGFLKITQEPITRIISKQLDIKLGPFTLEELDPVLRKIKNRKAARLDEIPPEVWKTRQFDDTLPRHCNTVYNQNPREGWRAASSLSLKRVTSN